jgi:hypothetical protein
VSELEISVTLVAALSVALGVMLYRRGARQRVVANATPLPPQPPRAYVRRRAAKRAAVAGLVLLAFVVFAIALSLNDLRIYGPGTGIPGAIFGVFALELISGRQFGYWAARWDRMSAARKLALGALIVAVAAFVILGTMGILVARFATP